MTTNIDPLALPLDGLHLIEASAGTGKTYAIAHLVLRLLLESGCTIDRILVLTFTDAATEELRERIARRLRQAQAALAGADPRDPLLMEWIGGLPNPALGRARLDAALADLDRAAIHTIHGFCARVLKDFAFESGAPFDAELITDEQDLRRTAAEDFWRKRMEGTDEDEAAWLLGACPQGPQSLLKRLEPFLGGELGRILGPDPTAIHDQDLVRGLHRRIRRDWPRVRDAVSALLLDNRSLSLTSYKPKQVAAALADMDALCDGPLPRTRPEKLSLFTHDKLAGATKKGGTTPEHPFFDLCDELAAIDFEGLDRARHAALLCDALTALRRDLERCKRERRVIYYDDLLTHSAAALDGPRGQALAARVRANYPQALIDEFQDTDSLQYRIFRATHGQDPAPGSGIGLYLIGDPKQAIYGFRGADIFAYISARRQAQLAGQTHTLNTNRRSASALVRACNRIFEQARAPFVFEDDIPFAPVESGPDADRTPLLIDAKAGPPLVFRWLPLTPDNAAKNGKRILADPARDAAVTDCARQIAALLAEPARLGDRALRAGDIAILVRAHKDGSAARKALGELGIGSVSIGHETVFESEEAEDLAALLAALRPGAGDGALRAALATRPLGWTAQALAGLEGDEQAWEQVLADFHGYREAWRNQGFIAAFEAILHGQGVPARLRQGSDGERRLTNLLHLAELAQAAAREHPGAEGLERWLAEHRADPKSGGDAALLRLESDENLVQVVTFHKSKGLEFPVVFLPITWSRGQPPDAKDPVLFHDRDTLDACLDLGSPGFDAHRALAAREDLAERLRLFYVALTRAKQRCVIHWGAINGADASAPAYLLHQGADGTDAPERMKGLSEADLRWDLDSLARAAPDSIEVQDLDAVSDDKAKAQEAPAPALHARTFTGTVPDHWRLLSFSALVSGQGAERPDYDALVAGANADDQSATTGAEEDAISPARPNQPVEAVFRFPRGTRAGHCLHDLFEHLDFRTAEGPALQQAAQSALARHGIETHWTDTLVELVARVLDTPLDPDGLRLRGLGPEDRRNELEFHFALDGFDPAALGSVLAAHGIAAGAALTPGRLGGLMKGFVDLVLRAGGRFYILDYKSNHLGDRVDDYDPDGIARAMTQHHYRVQYLIYTLALHRYLRTRLPGYDYDRHQGGALYLFLRGMRPEIGPGRGVFHDRPSLALVNDLDRVFGG